jgi:hypothetical protein
MKISQTLVALYEKYIRLFSVVFVKVFACFQFRVNAITDNLGNVFFRSLDVRSVYQFSKKIGLRFCKVRFFEWLSVNLSLLAFLRIGCT